MTTRYAPLALLLVLFLLSPVAAQPFVIDQAVSGGGPSADLGDAVALVDDGSRYVVGTFEGTATFGDVSVTSAGDSDVFLVKYDADGEALWARRGGTDVFNDFGAAGAVAPDGSVYAGGYFTGIATWDGGDNPDVVLTTFSDFDAFVAKYTADGDLEWVRQGGGTGQDTGRDLATDAEGNVYFAGSFSGTGTFGGVTLQSAGSSDAFLVKYDPDGEVVWARRGGSDQGDVAYGVAVTADGRAHLSGSFRGVAIFGDLPIQSAGETDVFVVQYDAGGEPVWVETIGADGSEFTRGGGIGLGADGSVYVTGSFQNSILVGSDVLVSLGFTDVFVAKLSAEGDELWGRRGGGNGTNFSAALAVGGGHVLATGYVDGTGTFADEPIATQGRDGYLAVFDAEGDLVNVELLGGTGQDAGSGVAASDEAERFAATGSFRGTATFSDLELTSVGSSDMYLIAGPIETPGSSIIYVDADATGAANGSSWTDAFTDLQDALAYAATLDVGGLEVWVTEDVYYPTKGTDQSIAFEIPSGLALYGSFRGTESSVEERPVTGYTVLNGNIGDEASLEDNSDVILRISGVIDEPILIDRFAAILGMIGLDVDAKLSPAPITLRRVAFTGNQEAGIRCLDGTIIADTTAVNSNDGDGIFSERCTLEFSASQVSSNGRAGVRAVGGAIKFKNLFVTENEAGGLLLTSSAQATLHNLLVLNNTSSTEGGGIRVVEGDPSNPVEIANSSISHNGASTGGGIYLEGGALRLINSTLVGNTASSTGGGITHISGILEVQNSILWDNVPPSFSTPSAGLLSVSHTLTQGGCPDGAVCEAILDTDPLFVDPPGDSSLEEGSPAVDFGLGAFLPADVLDLDEDGDTSEPLPIDRVGRPRIQGNAVDLGAFESPFAVALEPGAGVPTAGGLAPAYPNPFRAATTLALDVAEAQEVTVEVFDVLGRRVATVHDGPLQVGEHRVVIEARGLPAGVYVVRAEGETFRQTQRVTLVR